MKLNNFTGLIVDNSEAVLDQMLNDGLLKDIPIINTLIGLYNVKTTISDKIFYSKIINFYESFVDVNRDSFVKWNKWATENIEQSEKIASSLVLHIDAQNEVLKCKVIGHLFKKLVEGCVDKDEFDDFIYAISMSSTHDLQKHCIDGGDNSPSNESSLCQRLQFIGFYSFTPESLSSDNRLEYEISDKGGKFIDVMKAFDW